MDLATELRRAMYWRHSHQAAIRACRAVTQWWRYRACNQYRYVADVEHNTAAWILVWIFVAASVAAIVYAAVLMPLS
jgi:hypothetical protein